MLARTLIPLLDGLELQFLLSRGERDIVTRSPPTSRASARRWRPERPRPRRRAPAHERYQGVVVDSVNVSVFE